jgi:anti-sigma factor RsiW
MKDACDNLGEMLVDYADGLLDAEQAAKVTAHLAECDDCRALVQSLQSSLELAEAIWQDNLDQTDETIRIPAPARITRRSWLRYAVAAVILIVAGIYVSSRMTNKPAKKQATLAEIEQRITEAGDAAQLLAAADLLAGYSDVDTVKQQYRRIVETYPHTPAAAKAKSHIE